MFTRRTLLGFGWSGLCLGMGGGLTSFSSASARDPAEPWRLAGLASGTDPRLHALSWAILAPNSHNTQCWLVRLVGDDGIAVYCQSERRLPMSDPFDRQITITLGCFVELLVLAAGAAGRAADVTPFPEGVPGDRLDERPVALIRLGRSGSGRADPLFAHAPRRRTSREAFDTSHAVDPTALASLIGAPRNGGAVFVSGAAGTVADLRDLTATAFEIESRTPRINNETVSWLRIGKDEIAATPDGLAIAGWTAEMLHFVGLLNRRTLADTASFGFRAGLDRSLTAIRSAMAHVWLTTAGNDRMAQVSAGRDWLRLTLAATAAGLSLQPVGQCLQEYPEQDGPRADAYRLLAVDSRNTIQMLARLGYGPSPSPAARWPVEARLIRT